MDGFTFRGASHLGDGHADDLVKVTSSEDVDHGFISEWSRTNL